MHRRFALALTFAALLPQATLHAQADRPLLATPSVRVTAPVAGSAMVTLKGNMHPLAQARYDQGAVSTGLATGKLSLLLRRSPVQQAALDQYMGSLQDPNSPNYRKWLTPAQFGASFGIADGDLQAVETWLQSQGFKIEAVPASRNLVQFSGTMGQVGQAFYTSIHSYAVNGEQHLSNATDPQIPAALAAVVAGVSPLNDFRAKPLHVMGGRGQVQSVAGGFPSGLRAGQSSTPLLTGALDNRPFFYLTPSDAATIYNAPNSLNRNYTGSAQQAGAGINIGLVGNSDLKVADYLNYRRVLLGEAAPAQPNLVVDGVDPGVINGGNAQEALLDAELAAGLAPRANIYFYSSADDLLESGPIDASLRAIEDNNVAVLSVSFGTCEANLGVAGNQQINELWRQAAAQGITVVVASGDTGSAGCDDPAATQATGGIAVSGYASTPYNVAVGGTDFDALALSNGFAQYLGAANATFGTALGYIPENPWNDSISNNPPGLLGTNTAVQYPDPNGGPSFTVLSAGSGGPSTAAVCNGPVNGNGQCAVAPVGYTRPAFQSSIVSADTSIPTTGRLIPDISLFAAPGSQHSAGWAFCSDGDVNQAGNSNVDCQPAVGGSPVVTEIGGTSAASPAFAGVLATVIGSLPGTPRLGLANNVIYNLAATRGSVFHDVTGGNISVPCKTGSPNCTAQNFLTGWNAAAGYDLATGLGSVDIGALIAGWNAVVFTPTTTTLQANGGTTPISFQHGTALSLSANVTPASATGDVAVTATATGQGGAAVQEIISLTSGSGAVSPINTLPGGSYSIQAYYQGDATHAPSLSGPAIPVSISPEASAPFLFTAISGNSNQNPPTATYGQYGFAYIEPGNTNALNANVGYHGIATGTAIFLNNSSTLGTQTLNSQGVAAFPLYDLAPGVYSFSARYNGDSSYNPSSTTTPVALSISKGPTTLTIHAGSAGTGAPSRTITVQLDTQSSGASPTGAVTLTLNGSVYQSTSVQNGLNSSGFVALLGNFSVPATAITGSNRLSATYAGDGNYNNATAATCSYAPPATTTAVSHRESHALLAAAEGSMALCSLLFLGVPSRKRAWRSLLGLLFVAGLAAGAIGCGSTSNSSNQPVPIVSACAQ